MRPRVPKGRSSRETVAGMIELHTRNDEAFSTATLKMGSGTTGLLVTEVKKQIRDRAKFAILDGSPGIGCPVIASLTGVDLALMVAEPSLSGISDLQRLIQTPAASGADLRHREQERCERGAHRADQAIL